MSETEQANVFLDVDNVIDKFNSWSNGKELRVMKVLIEDLV